MLNSGVHVTAPVHAITLLLQITLLKATPCNQLSKRTPLSPPFVRSFFSRQNEKISGEQVITLKGMAKKDLLYEQGATSFVCAFLFCVELRWVESVMICGISGPVTRF